MYYVGLLPHTCSYVYPNLHVPYLVLKARNLGGSTFYNFHWLGVPEQALGGITLGFGVVVKDKPFMHTHTHTHTDMHFIYSSKKEAGHVSSNDEARYSLGVPVYNVIVHTHHRIHNQLCFGNSHAHRFLDTFQQWKHK